MENVKWNLMYLINFQCKYIDISSIPTSTLSNAGLLICTLKCDNEDVIDVNIVIQVSKEGDDYIRCIYNPLE